MKHRIIPESIQDRIKDLPDGPGVYIFRDRRRVPVYIGKALSIRKRVRGHFRSYGENFSKEGILLGEVSRIDFIETPTEGEALLLEAGLVKEHQPKFNKELKDDKSYPYLKITGEEFPRLLVVRGRRPDGGSYFGPYTNVRLLRQAVRMLRRLFPMRTCSPMPNKVCLMYHIGLCRGPCEDRQTRSDYLEAVKELGLFLEGRRHALVRNLLRRMKEYSARREYEKAKSVYEEIRALSSLPGAGVPKDGGRVLDQMQKALALPRRPRRIEGFDISNIAGREAVGSMVVFVEGKPARQDYRRFRIRTVEGIDDYRMIREVVRRRYSRLLEEKKALPDLVVIDGGKGHLTSAKKELDALGLADLPVISIAKQHEHLFKHESDRPIIFPQNAPLLHLLQYLRDEAHRFAIGYHRRLHKKEALMSLLDRIPGVGPKTRERLLKKVGSVQKIASLSERELGERAGLSGSKARVILQTLRQLA